MSDTGDKGGRGRGAKGGGGFGKGPGGPRGQKPPGGRPSGDRPKGEGPARPGAPAGDRPRFGRPGFGKPRGDGPRSDASRSDRPRGERPFRERPAADAQGGEKRFSGRPHGRSQGQRDTGGDAGERPRSRPRSEGERPPRREEGERKAFKPFAERMASTEGGEPRRFEKKPYAPKSRGMLSHGGPADGEAPSLPRSYGRREPDKVVRDRPERSERPERGDRGPRPAFRPREEPSGEESARGVETMRIAKRLARAGIASRREAEGMIADGRIAVNGKVLESPALDVTARDRIEIDGQPIPAIERTRLWLFHKPAGTVTTNHDPEGRPTVFDRLPEDMPRVLSVGRLDINTEGLLLLTNDGGLSRMLELPATGWLRRYRVRAHGEISQEKLDELRQGIAIDGVFYGAIEASLDRTQGANVWLTLGLREGKNREVKRVLGHLGLDVNRLIRLSFGPFQLADLEEGAVREIKGRTLRDQLGDRLIEESGADFDAPVVNEFSNKPVKAEPEDRPAGPKKRGDWISASETAPNKKRFREEKRDDALGRLDTRPNRRGDGEGRGERPARSFDGPKKSFGARKPFTREEAETGPKRPAAAAPRRSANVWMAPGARPRGKAAEEAAAEKRAGFKPRSESGFKPRPGGGDRPSSAGPRRPAPGGPKRPPRDRG